MSVSAGICEEIFYRGLLLTALTALVGLWPAVLLSSVAFGLGHAYQGPASILSIGLKSVLFGWVFLRTGRIRALIIAHALYDSAQIILAVIELRSL